MNKNSETLPEPWKPLQRARAFVYDTKGIAWTWNSGWYIVDNRTGHHKTMTPLGHAAFRRNISVAKPEDLRNRIGPRARPSGMWRRVIDIPYEHRPTGLVGSVAATDGVHAIFHTRDEDGDFKRMEVMFNNLDEAKPSSAPSVKHSTPRTSSKTKTNKTKAEKSAKSRALLESLGFNLDDLIK